MWEWAIGEILLFIALFFFHELGHMTVQGSEFIRFKRHWLDFESICFDINMTPRHSLHNMLFGFIGSLPIVVIEFLIFKTILLIPVAIILATADFYNAQWLIRKVRSEKWSWDTPFRKIPGAINVGWWRY